MGIGIRCSCCDNLEQMQNGDLVTEHRGFAVTLAQQYCRRMPVHVEISDAVSTADAALVEAAMRFRPADKELAPIANQFLAFARIRIFGALTDMSRKDSPLLDIAPGGKRHGLMRLVNLDLALAKSYNHERDAVASMEIREAVDRMPRHLRRVAIAYYWEGMNGYEAAAALAISEPEFWNRRREALAWLRCHMAAIGARKVSDVL